MAFVAMDGTVLDKQPVNQHVNSKGEFITPRRLANESKSSWNKRIKQAQYESGLFPRLTRATGVQQRHRDRDYALRDKEILKIQGQLKKIDSFIGTENEYQASIQKPGLEKKLARLTKINASKFSGTTKYKKERYNANLAEGAEERGNVGVSGGDADYGGAYGPGGPSASDILAIQKKNKQDAQFSSQNVETDGTGSVVQESDKYTNKSTDVEPANSDAQVTVEPKDQLRIRSDVHTIDPATGERLGVMTNRQREAWEKDPKNQKYLQDSAKNKNNLRIYKDKKGNTIRTAGGKW